MIHPNTRAVSRDPWLKKAKILSLVLLFGTIVFVAGGLTIGLITGLILLMAPMYVIGAVCTLAAICVSLCLWRRWYWTALTLGSLILLTPTTVLVSWYAMQWQRCKQVPDPQACLAYLNGSILLPIFIFICCVVTIAGCSFIVLTVLRQRKQGISDSPPKK